MTTNLNVNIGVGYQAPQNTYQPQQPQMYQPPQPQMYQPPQPTYPGQNQGYSQPQQQPYPGQHYAPPTQNNTNVTPIIINNQGQGNNVIVRNDPFKFKTESVLATCPSCKVSSNTNVITNFSFSNYMCYFCFGWLFWLIYQLARSKDINCCDATHHCSGCGSFIANYEAC